MRKQIRLLVLSAFLVTGVWLYLGFDRHPGLDGALRDRVFKATPDHEARWPSEGNTAFHASDQNPTGDAGTRTARAYIRDVEPPSVVPISFRQELDALDEAALSALALDPTVDQADRRAAWDVLMARIEKMENQTDALDALLGLKDQVDGEDQQTVMKMLGAMNNQTANEAIAETVSSSFFETDESNLARMLSYLNPQYPLSNEAADQLIALYPHVREDGLALAIINALAVGGGDSSIDWIVTQAESAGSKTQEMRILSALSQSNSQRALVYLNQRLNELAADEYTPEDSLEQLRQTILVLKKHLTEES